MRKAQLPRWFAPEASSPGGSPDPGLILRLEETVFFRSLNLKPTREMALPGGTGNPRRVIRYEGSAGDDVSGKFKIRVLALQEQDPGHAVPWVMEYSLFLDKPSPGQPARSRRIRLRIFRNWVEMHGWPEEVVARLLEQFNQAEREAFHVSQDPLLAARGIVVTSSGSDTFLTWARIS
jgi:hypothetical protein